MGRGHLGRVTFLFTDIEGSTRLWDENPESMKAATARVATLPSHAQLMARGAAMSRDEIVLLLLKHLRTGMLDDAPSPGDGFSPIRRPVAEYGEHLRGRTTMEPLIKYPILQHAWFVNDIDAACNKWHRMTGAGPFFVSRGHWGDRHLYRGQEMTVPLDYAFGYHGDTHVQFIQQNHEGPSIYRDMFKAGEEGFHHIGMLVPDDDIEKVAAEFEAAGFPVASSLWAIANVIYVDAREAIGCFLECHGDNPQIRGVFDGWKKAHDEWDGHTDLIRGNRGQPVD